MGNHRVIDAVGGSVLLDIDDFEIWKFHTLSVVCRGHLKHAYLNTKELKGQPLHRQLFTNLSPEDIVDHINGNGLDNRRCNLRITNKVGNALNMRKNITKTNDLPKGVFKTRKDGTYRACIQINKVYWELGKYPTVQAAEDAYLAALSDYWNYTGALGRLRKIQEPSSGIAT